MAISNQKRLDAFVKILIVGLPKSGTTALFSKLREALPADTPSLFEPRRFDLPETETTVLAKILIGQAGDVDYASFRPFEHRILIVRDPRDHLVSRLLYRACADPEFREDDSKVSRFIETMRQKEAHPRSLSLLDLLDRYNGLRAEGQPPSPPPKSALPRSWATGSYLMALDFHRREGAFLVCKYEDVVAGRYEPIEHYLGMRLPPGEAVVAEQYRHVAQTKGSGDWRYSLTTADVDFFRPFLLPYMHAYGYEDEWTLAAEPRIPPEHASEFVERSVAHRRRSD